MDIEFSNYNLVMHIGGFLFECGWFTQNEWQLVAFTLGDLYHDAIFIFTFLKFNIGLFYYAEDE